MDNGEKLKIIENISDVVRSRSLIEIPGIPSKFEYLSEMFRKRLIIMSPVSSEKYIWPYYIEHDDFIQFVFPTPPFNNKLDSDLKKTLTKFIEESRKCICEIIAKKPQKIVMDLRNNFGGFLYVFYDSLLPLLPVAENQELISGVDRNGNDYMKMSNISGKMILAFPGGQETRELHQVTCRPTCPIDVWVNPRSASSSELIMILCKQEGYEVFGEPTLGLTTGMSSIMIPDGELNFPKYVFKDKHGKVYQPHDSHITIGSKHKKEFTGIAGELQQNVLINIPDKILKNIDSSTGIPVFNNIISEYFSNNYHSGIEYKKSPLSYAMTPTQLYIQVPKKCNTKISSVLDEFKSKIKLGFPVLIDLRNAVLGDDNNEFLPIFNGMFKPWKVQLIETSHNQEDGYDSKLPRLSKKNLLMEYAYVANKYPYTFGEPRNESGEYSGINAKFWVNKFSTSGNIASCIFLLYIKNVFGLYTESSLGDYYDYSFHKYTIGNIEVQIYSDKFLDESK